jgi:hypothetical protein
MAKITFLGNFRVDYSTESHHVKTLESLGHKVIKLQETEVTSEIILQNAKESNLFVWVHTHGWNTPGKLTMESVLKFLKDAGVPSMTYHLDLWFGLKRQKDLKRDPVYLYIDHFFTVDNQMAKWFNENTNVRGHYLPAAVFDQECSYSPKQPEHEVIFVGSKNYHAEWQYRPKLINWLENTYSNSFELWGGQGKGIVRGNDLNKLYATTKVVVGDSLCPKFNYPDYWSDRVYETMGRGGFIIHPYISGMEKHFTDKKHLIFYDFNNFDQLKNLIDHYLAHPKEAEAIRKAGFKHVKNNHTYKNRWTHILKEVLSGE